MFGFFWGGDVGVEVGFFFSSFDKTKNSPFYFLTSRIQKHPRPPPPPLFKLLRPARLHQKWLLLQRRRDRRGGAARLLVDDALRDGEGRSGRLRARHGLELVRPELWVLRSDCCALFLLFFCVDGVLFGALQGMFRGCGAPLFFRSVLSCPLFFPFFFIPNSIIFFSTFFAALLLFHAFIFSRMRYIHALF